MKNKFLIALVPLLAVACAPAGNTEEDTSKAASKGAPFVEVVKPSKIEYTTSLDITGNLVANQEVMVHAMEGGALTDLRVDIGDVVRPGAVLATMSNPSKRDKETPYTNFFFHTAACDVHVTLLWCGGDVSRGGPLPLAAEGTSATPLL